MVVTKPIPETAIRVWSWGMAVSALLFVIGSWLIMKFHFQEILKKELLCSWLLVFINAYVGAFIANQALKRGPTAFFVWSMLINSARIGVFLILLLVISKLEFLNFRAFVSVTIFGYLVFLAGEVASLHTQSLRALKLTSKE